jgi:hypothetical protein
MHSCALILGKISTSLVRVSTYGGCGGGGGGVERKGLNFEGNKQKMSRP